MFFLWVDIFHFVLFSDSSCSGLPCSQFSVGCHALSSQLSVALYTHILEQDETGSVLIWPKVFLFIFTSSVLSKRLQLHLEMFLPCLFFFFFLNHRGIFSGLGVVLSFICSNSLITCSGWILPPSIFFLVLLGNLCLFLTSVPTPSVWTQRQRIHLISL